MENRIMFDGLNLTRLTVTHVVVAQHESWAGRNSLPVNRIFFVFGRKNAVHGYIKQWRNGKVHHHMDLKGQHIYFMPENVDLEFNFTQGFPVIAFHFNLEIFPGQDLFKDYHECHMETASQSLIRQVHSYTTRTSSLKDILNMQAILLEIAAKYLTVAGTEIQRLDHLRSKYSHILNAVEHGISAKTTVDELAAKTGLHRDTLSKSFAKDIGIPLKSYLIKAVTDKAVNMLLYSNRKISEIAAELQFNNEQYFCMFFKKYTGKTPNTFRNDSRWTGR